MQGRTAACAGGGSTRGRRRRAPRSRAARLGGGRGRAMQGRGHAVAEARRRGHAVAGAHRCGPAVAAERGWQRWRVGDVRAGTEQSGRAARLGWGCSGAGDAGAGAHGGGGSPTWARRRGRAGVAALAGRGCARRDRAERVGS
ncbi:uncharacterized protein [Miscanthus floridulus]|uniref:uncharacterized protein n=1 Tax=Miscanthus floridulus TaxID=154761 RepID=UPI003457BAF0